MKPHIAAAWMAFWFFVITGIGLFAMMVVPWLEFAWACRNGCAASIGG